MGKRLLIGVLVLGCSLLFIGGCTPSNEGPAETTKPLTDAEFEASIANAPEVAKASARAEREKAKNLMKQQPPPKK